MRWSPCFPPGFSAGDDRSACAGWDGRFDGRFDGRYWLVWENLHRKHMGPWVFPMNYNIHWYIYIYICEIYWYMKSSSWYKNGYILNEIMKLCWDKELCGTFWNDFLWSFFVLARRPLTKNNPSFLLKLLKTDPVSWIFRNPHFQSLEGTQCPPCVAVVGLPSFSKPKFGSLVCYCSLVHWDTHTHTHIYM